MQPLRVNLPAAPVAVRVLPGPGGEPASGVLAEADGPESLEAERSALARACGALEQAAKRLHALGQEIRAEAEDHLLDLAVDIARKVIAQEIQTERCDIEPIVREALGRAPPRREVVVHLHPADLAALEKAGPEGVAPADLAHVRLSADPTLGRAECVVETAEGSVEARTEDRLAQVRAAMKLPE